MGRNFRRTLIALLLMLVIGLISVTPLWRSLQGLLQPWLSPLVRSSTQVGNWFDLFLRWPSLVEENERLYHQVSELAARQLTSEALKSENEELRRLLSVPVLARHERLAVEIIGRQVDETGVSYLINRGRTDGLQSGLAVVAGTPDTSVDLSGVILVGTLKDIGERVSSLTLITSANSIVLAKLAQGLTGQSLAVGEYNLAVRLKFLEIDQPIAVGDAVVTSNLNQLIPPDILIGTVTTVEKFAGELFQTAVVSPPVPLEQFRFLYVLKPVQPL